MEHRIKKIKYDQKRVTVVQEVHHGGGGDPDVIKIACREGPREEFCMALAALVPHVLDILCLELGESHDWLVGIRICGVSFSWPQDVMGATVTATVDLPTANAPLVINTPHLTAELINESSEAPLMSQGMATALRVLIDEAQRYLAGHRAQMILPFEPEFEDAA
jgi:hypothetical protein